jgi:hypothetical protein
MKTKVEFMVVIKGQKMFYTTEQAAKLAATVAKTKYFKVKTLVLA